MTTSVETVPQLVQWLTTQTGLDFDGCHRDRMNAAIRDVLRESSDRPRFSELVDPDGDTLPDLIDRLTVSETYFMREPAHFELLVEIIAPQQLAGGRRGLRVWSAGCASGEEPYSVAIALDEAGLLAGASIVGTDLSHHALGRARRGVYREWSLRRCSDEQRLRWFRHTGPYFELADQYRRAVRWQVGGLLEGPPGRAFDVVLCRNVLIYLTPDAVDIAAATLHDALVPGGWLLVGSSDPPLEHHGLQRTVLPSGVVYRRTGIANAAKSSPKQAGPARDERQVSTARNADPIVPPRRRTGVGPVSAGTADRRRGTADTVSAASPGHPTTSTQQALDASGRYDAAVGHVEHRRFADAAHELAAARYLDPAMVAAHLLLAHVAEQVGDDAEAQRGYGTALRLLAALPEDTIVDKLGEPAGQLVAVLLTHQRRQEHVR